jgi:uncharacterized membrane protein YphA (DoxX/SURF4 family)
VAIAQRLPKAQLNRPFVDRTFWTLRVALGLVFLAASIPKIERPFDFLGIVYDYSLVGPSTGLLIARTLPWLELVVGLCLVAGVLAEGALMVGGTLLSIFAVAEFLVFHRGNRVPCGCFSFERVAPVNWHDAALSGGLAVAAIGLLILHRRPLPPQMAVLEPSHSSVRKD